MGALYRFDISSLIEGYGIKNFVETGTLHGDAVELVDSLGLVDEIHSIELLDKLHKECVDRFEGRDHIKIHKGLSVISGLWSPKTPIRSKYSSVVQN